MASKKKPPAPKEKEALKSDPLANLRLDHPNTPIIDGRDANAATTAMREVQSDRFIVAFVDENFVTVTVARGEGWEVAVAGENDGVEYVKMRKVRE